ncbi:MAG TPA: adenylate/guanylate cyclase domain-containing protein [Casimicrobiaceae bacterium]|nr:adenylate/guanylate cyclase domain-containing protein [Casimicrobiaceae bacterium]
MPESTTLTFLFTDIEGSTAMWEEQPEQMAQAMSRHDALLRDCVQRHDGRIVKTTGDGIYAVFEKPAHGLAAVLDIQLALLDPATTAGIALRVRCGLHAGLVQARDNDYFGSTVNRAARIMNAAHGGQILVSQALADEFADALPAHVTLKSLGAVRLKGLAASEAVFQVVHPRLYQNFPALRELEATPNNLPQQLTSFIGRERERHEIEEMLHGARLLTLLGMGGLGKTRLALAVGTNVMDSYPDGVWFVDLQMIRDDALVAGEAARVLGVREEPGRPLIQTLTAHLRTRKSMLILDNCEQVVDACAELVNAILRGAPDVRVVTTSRIALRVPGEQTYIVQPLPVPMRTESLDALRKSTAVQLFVERARLHKPSFALTEREAPAVAELVFRLEGIPLALELAAARVRTLTVPDINKRLNDRYKILTGGDRTLQARQQTLRALVDWSYDLLEEGEQVLLARLSVFAGGFGLAAVETVCGVDPLTAEDVLDVVTSLVEKSLLRVEEGEDGARYRLLETIRDYAREKLIMRDELFKLAATHCAYYFVMAKAANSGSKGAEQGEWNRRVETELDNIRAAIGYALEGGGDPIIAVKFGVALQGFWTLRGYATEGRRYVRAALALPEVQGSDVAHAWALYVGAALADGQGNHVEAKGMLEACLALRRKLSEPIDVAATLSTLSLVRLHAGDAEGAFTGEQEALDLFRQIDNPIGEAIGLLHLGQIHAYVGDERKAIEHLEQCLAIAQRIKYSEVESECEVNLGELALGANDVAAASKRFSRALVVSQDAGDRRSEATALWWMGKLERVRGDWDAARVRLGGALRAFRAFEMNEELLGCLEDHAGLWHSLGQDVEAVRMHAAVEASRRRLALARPPRAEARIRASVASLRASLGDLAFDTAWSAGTGWEISEAADVALAVAPEAAIA